MKWLSKFFPAQKIEKKSATTTTTIPIAPGSFLEYIFNSGGKVSASQAMEFYRRNDAIATSVDLIAGSIEQIRPVLKTANGKLDDNHEVIKLLNNPNGFNTWKEFIGDVSRHYLLKHDSHVQALGNIRNPPIQLFAVKPQLISVQEDLRDGYPSKYIVPRGAGSGNYDRKESIAMGARFYDTNLKELFHLKGFSSRSNNVEGDSPLEAAALAAKQQIEGGVHNLQTLRNGGRLSLIVKLKDDTNVEDDEHEERKKAINEQLSGSHNAGKIAVITADDVDITEVGKTNKDMDYAKLLEMAGIGIYLRYNIPLPLVLIKASTFNNMKTGIELLYDLAVLPNFDTIMTGLSKFLLPRYGINPAEAQITYDPDSITALMDRRLEQIKKRVAANLETRNELRTLLPNRAPLKEGGDVVYQAANLIPVGEELEVDEGDDEKALRLLKRDGV